LYSKGTVGSNPTLSAIYERFGAPGAPLRAASVVMIESWHSARTPSRGLAAGTRGSNAARAHPSGRRGPGPLV